MWGRNNNKMPTGSGSGGVQLLPMPRPPLRPRPRPRPRQIFLLSPANAGGQRAQLLHNPRARFELALKLRTPQGAMLGEVFAFLSGLYFRGKLAYALTFSHAPRRCGGVQVITTDRGLVPPQTFVTLDDLRAMGSTPIDSGDARYRRPLEEGLAQLVACAGARTQFILLGSIASGKYVDVLKHLLGPRLLFPAEFIGRGDMSRGGLMLRCVEERRELTYVPVVGTHRHGKRPPKLVPKPGILLRALQPPE